MGAQKVIKYNPNPERPKGNVKFKLMRGVVGSFWNLSDRKFDPNRYYCSGCNLSFVNGGKKCCVFSSILNDVGKDHKFARNLSNYSYPEFIPDESLPDCLAKFDGWPDYQKFLQERFGN